ncbi:hypothetical protein M885DRAFT_508522 [Pelagophyceae sp. CCMP2097]|nr:hypothetical protein M885DRAFT_508522 [Pelagophyceae sp. CCMP2097]
MTMALRTLVLAALCGATAALKVAVSGAGGQTGGHVFRKLLARPGVDVVGWARSSASRDALIASSDATAADVRVVDVTDEAACLAAMAGFDALVICTSAKPAMTGIMTPEGRPTFSFPNGQPVDVDWLGQKTQIDACVANKAHVVICSSMGGSNEANPLNALGREALADGAAVKDAKGGNILLWKRKAEKYAIDSGTPYTIVHPGGLLNQPGGKREIVAGVDDEALASENRSIPREDVATVLVAALFDPAFRGRAFDVRAKNENEGTVTPPSCVTLIGALGGRNCDYTLGTIPN